MNEKNSEIQVVGNERKYLTANEMIAQANLIQQVMKAVMIEDTHFGKVPGCGDKPTLLKPGAEKILATFRISVIPEIEDLSGPDLVKYRVKARGVSGGVVVGEGVGTCSSNEEKYKWRKAVGKEYDETPEDRRRKKWRKGYGGGAEYQEEQVRMNPADIDNTILKMAKKRALVDLCLTSTAASDCFNQDIEDLPVEFVDAADGSEAPKTAPMPQRKSEKADKAPEKPKKTTSPAPSSAPDDVEPPIDDDAPAAQPGPIPSGFKLITASYAGQCRGCGEPIQKGTQIAYKTAAKAAYHTECAK